MVNNREIAVWLALAILPRPFVNRGQVVQHPVGLRNFVFEMAEKVMDFFFCHPERRDSVAR